MSANEVGSPPEGAAAPFDEQDDEALHWGDEHDTTHVAASENAITTGAPRERHGEAPSGSGALVGMGVIGGVYLLYTVAWLITASTAYVSAADALLTSYVEILRVLAIVAPAAWFTVTLWVGSSSRTRVRVGWLLLGVVVLFPWPFLMTRSF